MLYMDYNATTPLAVEVVADITESLSDHWANPSSSHAPGNAARSVVEEARGHVAMAIGAQPDHVVFTSGGTEANNMVIRGSLEFYSATGRAGTPHVITTDIEHDAVSEPVGALERRGLCTVSRLSCSDGGRVLPASVIAAVTADTCLVSVMHANNETGVLSDIEGIGSHLARLPNRHHIWFHTDSAQTVGKVEVDVTRLGVDFLTVVGHKLYGPRIGALWLSPLGLTRHPCGGACVALLGGGGQERRLRPGTENTPLIRGLGTACRLVAERTAEDGRRMARLRDALEARLLETGVAERINLSGSPRLPNTSSVVLAGQCSGRAVLARCRRLLASVGSACHEAGGAAAAASAVLLRSGVLPEHARRTVRLSLGRQTSEQDVTDTVEELRRALAAATGAERGAPDPDTAPRPTVQ